MRINKLYVFIALCTFAFASCKKDHYNMDHLQGVEVDGEVLLPVASASFTLSKLIQQFKIDSIISCSEDGDLFFGFNYEDFGVINGEELLRFKDLDYSEHFSVENPFPFILPQAFDTMFHFDHTITFKSDNIHVMEAVMKSGHFEFNLSSNIGLLQRVVIRSSDIKDAYGQNLMLDFNFDLSDIHFDLDGLKYSTDTANTLDLSYDLYFRLQGAIDHELYLDIDVQGRDLAIKEMSGYVDRFVSRNYIDTTYCLFSDNVLGSLDVYGARLNLYERNTFNLEAQLEVDTAWIINDDNQPFAIFGSQPLTVDIPTRFQYEKVLEKSLNGRISANALDVFAASSFIVNPSGMSDMVSVTDSCVIDVMADAKIPFDFAINDVRYLDTTNLDLSEIKMPDQIERLVLELSITSTIPLNMNAQFLAYDSENDRITDTLVAEDNLISASYNGQPKTTMVTLEITGDKLSHIVQSDRLISCYEIDTDAHNVLLKGHQGVNLFMKAKVKYNGIVDY